MKSIDFTSFLSLSAKEQEELTAEHNTEIAALLPVLGPIFSLAVILFNLWDHLIDPAHAWVTLAVRCILVSIGALAYLPLFNSWPAIKRCSLIYWTHVSAIILSEYLLKDGFLYGLSGICACVFTVSILTYQVRTFFYFLSLPSLLFIVLSYQSAPRFNFINGLMMYLFSLGIAWITMLSIRSFRRRTFAVEQELLHHTRHDSLTGVNNRAYVNELGERQFALAKRHHHPFSVCMLDIDNFKRINDTYGHSVGDAVIRSLAQTCLRELREIDHFGRIGGEEFVCILPETTSNEALLCMDRIRAAIAANSASTDAGPIQFTASVGIATLDVKHCNWEALLKDADIAMYEAKRLGRNRVEIHR
ncbi:GGDEF domain-containing protein [Undibacterium sp.]|uniref:GGDEF domain-containing protein n=1 Tax=Undibacterium sp. TaxID=1914977 RepID=UPI003751331D